MRFHPTRAALFLVVALPDCTAAHEAHPAEDPRPMASFARMVGGEWQTTFANGATAFHAWFWGPGRYSMRRMTAASGGEWTGDVMYWHPGRRQVCVLTMHEDIPGVGRGVGEGTIRFDGDTSDSVFTLDQPRGPRKLGSLQVFDGPDGYRETLLEDVGAGLKPMNGWSFVRIPERPAVPRRADPAPLEVSKHLKPFEALVSSTWEGKTDAALVRSTFEWIPSLEAVFARAVATNQHGELVHELEAYFYLPIRTDVMRCLALSSGGVVYEGDLTVLDGGALQLDLKGHEGDRVVAHVLRLDIDKDGTLRQRDWSLEGTRRTLLLDLSSRKLGTKGV